MSDLSRFGDELEKTLDTLNHNRRGRIHTVAHHNGDGTRTYLCGKVSSPHALRHALPDMPRCQGCEAMKALDADLNDAVHPSIRIALDVLNALDRGEAGK